METRIALITGGNRGLGRAMALHLARAGIGVVFTWRSDEAEAQAVLADLRATGAKAAALRLDLGSTEGFDAFAESLAATLKQTFGAENFDILINNAGIGIHKSFAETSEAEFDALMDVHLRAPFFLTQRLLPMLNDGGRIVMLSTGLARFTLPGYAAYATMKGGVEVLTRYLARELGPRGISVNVLAPGAIETDFSGGVVRDNPGLNQMIAGATAQGRVGLPDDIGGAVAALLAPDAGWITGQRIEVSGGQSL